jgi:hypothetical protein
MGRGGQRRTGRKMTAQSRQREKVARMPKIRSISLQFRSSMAIRVSVRVEAGSGQRV